MNLFKRLFNTGYVGARAALKRRIPFWPIERIERLQRHRVRSIVRHAYTTAPFYRDAMEQRGLKPGDFRSADDLARLPLLDDLTVRNNPELFASTRYSDQSRLTAYTSGSTSHVQKKIYWDHTALLDLLCYSERHRAVLNALLGRGWGQRQLFIIPQGSITLALRSFWDAATLTPPQLARRHFVPVSLPLKEMVREINTIKPEVVFSYGSFADLFFRWLADRKLTITLPRVWMYGADMLSDDARKIMEKQFGCIPYTTYQAGETGRIGFQCERRRGFHLNVDAVPVRLVDENGRTVRPGEVGEVVVSNLYNRAMVLLNYRLGDLGALSTIPCPCGRSLPLLAGFEGRCTEVLQLPDGRKVPYVMFEVLLKNELHDTIQAQMVQSSPARICWRIVPASNADREKLRAQILAKSSSFIGPEIQVTVEFAEHIPSTGGGKFRRVIRDSTLVQTEQPGPRN